MLSRNIRRGRRRLRHTQIGMMFAVVGPGITAAFGGNDASGIYGYSLAGAQYGYSLIWVLILVAVALGVCQEMCARMGAVTGKGLADLIREEYGVRVTLFAMTALLIANFATTVSEFAGITAAIEIFAPPGARWFVIPAVAILVWLLVTRGTYQRVERILLSASLIYIAYVASAFMAHPPWGHVLGQAVWPHSSAVRLDATYIFVVINIIGTTITPWGQFYIQSSVRDKGVRPEAYTPADPLFGAFTAILVAFFIVVCCGTTLFHAGVDPNRVAAQFNDAGKIAVALKPAAGQWATLLFAVGLFNASCFGVITVPLSTAYAVTESLGWESGLGRRVREAPLFIGVFTFLIVVSALIVLFGGKNLAALIILPNIVGGMLLPIILFLMLRLINNKRIMGDHTNSRLFNVIAWTTTIILVVLSVALIVLNVLPKR